VFLIFLILIFPSFFFFLFSYFLYNLYYSPLYYMPLYPRSIRVSWPKPSLRFKRIQDNAWCPYCWNEHIWMFWANSAKTQRYRCSKCHKTFSFWGKKRRVYTDVFRSDIVFYYKLGSYGWLRSTCRACGISTNTLYRWLRINSIDTN